MKRLSLTTWSILALSAGLGLGILGHQKPSPVFDLLAEWTQVFGKLWIAALQLTVLPLVISNLLATISGAGAKSVGKLGLRALFVFGGLLLAAGLFAIILTPKFIARLSLDADTATTISTIAASANGVGPTAAQNNVAPASTAELVGRLLPSNLLEAGLKGDLFTLLLFTGFFGMAVTRLPNERQLLLANIFQGLADAMLQLTRWIVVASPIGVFALTYALAFKTGISAGGILGTYILVVSSLMLLFTLLLYPISAIIGRTRIGDFARAVAPAQLVAISTRSSIAALPAMIEAGKDRLRLPSNGTSFVLPLSVSLLKVNRPISSIVKLMLVAHIFGIQLRPGTIAIFLATVVILSFTAPGIPQSGPGLKTIPAYIAAGIPIEAVIVLEAVEAIPDIFKTLLNVTGDMTAATLLTRSERSQSQVIDVESATVAEGAL